MRKKSLAIHVMKRDNVFYYVRHAPNDLIDHYSVKRLCFSLKTKCESLANRSSRSITQRLDDYWYGIRFSKLDVPINNLMSSKQNNTEVSSKVFKALELYLRLKGGDRDKVFLAPKLIHCSKCYWISFFIYLPFIQVIGIFFVFVGFLEV